MPAVEITYSVEEFHRARSTGEVERTGQLYRLIFDAITREGHSVSALLTEHVVEGGASISDHKAMDLRRLSLSCVVTDSPLGTPPDTGSRTSGVTGTLTQVEIGGSSAVGLVYSGEVTRTVDVYAELVDLVARPVSVTVRTGLAVYEGLQVVSVSAPKTAADGNGVEFGIDFRELRTARVETTRAPQPRAPRNKKPADRGAQPTAAASAEQAERVERSILKAAKEGRR